MGRPRRVIYEKFKDYDLFHTQKTEMMSGVVLNTLYAVKETALYWMGIESWAYCAGKFRMKKKNLPELSVQIDIVTDQKSVNFLEENSWSNYIEDNPRNIDLKESVDYLDRLYPEHKKVYLRSFADEILVCYNNGVFLADNEFRLKNSKRINANHNRSKSKDPKVLKLLEKYKNYKGADSDKSYELYSDYKKLKSEVDWKENNLIPTIVDICSKAVCFPVAFSNGTGMWGIEKYGRPMAYSNAGEIFFVVTEDAIYFDITRHF